MLHPFNTVLEYITHRLFRWWSAFISKAVTSDDADYNSLSEMIDISVGNVNPCITDNEISSIAYGFMVNRKKSRIGIFAELLRW